jgi:hypothetical protein
MSPGSVGRQPNRSWVRALDAGTLNCVPGGIIRPDLTTIPLHGVAPSHVILATRAADRSRLVAAFHRSAQDCLTGPGAETKA